MISKNIIFKNFSIKKNQKKISINLKLLLNKQNKILESLTPLYNYSYKKDFIKKYKNKKNFVLIGMGGSILGSQAIYDFLKHKIKKKFKFIGNLDSSLYYKNISKKNVNIIISKSGNTLETIANSNVFLKKNDKNIFITEKKNSYLSNLGKKLCAEIIEHNNFIGGRYSVLSEVGMLPAELMGLNEKKFKQFNNLIKDKRFTRNLISNVACTLYFLKKGLNTSIVLNYDERSENIFKWYQQLISESLGKKSKGFLPVISSMPKDNHSLMQFYLDGPKNNFYTFFHVKDKNSLKIKNNRLSVSTNYIKNKNLNEILYSQKVATENIFKKKKIPFRSFEILKRDEKSLGELFSFFILETILLGRALNVNPYDQPSVELIKKETKKILLQK